MNQTDQPEHAGGDAGQGRAVRKRSVQVLLQYALLAAMLFISAGDFGWVWAWALLGVGLIILVVNLSVLPRELIGERGQPKEGVKSWDRVLTGVSVLPALASPVVAGLDRRFAWTGPLPVAVHLAALVVWVAGQALFTWAMVSNRFFSTLVRIQLDRGHTVAHSGPYRHIRHPGYLAYIIFIVAMPVVLGSLWGLVPAGVTVCILVAPMALEDRTLQAELEGYETYARTVRYRLLPGVW